MVEAAGLEELLEKVLLTPNVTIAAKSGTSLEPARMSALRVRDPLVASVATAELLTATIVAKLVILPVSVKMSAWRVRVHRVDAVEAGGAVHAAAPPWRTSSVISAMKRGILREIVPRTHWITSNVTTATRWAIMLASVPTPATNKQNGQP